MGMHPFVLLATILIWILIGCISNNDVDSEQQIYIQVIIQPEIGVSILNLQIWRIGVKSFETELVAELHSSIEEEPITEIFSTQELTAFKGWYNFSGGENNYPALTEIYPERTHSHIVSSPNNQYLAWREGNGWGPPNSTISFGMTRLVLLDLHTGERRVFQEVANHPDGEWGIGRYIIGNIVWSPDSQLIAFIEGWHGAHQAKIVNIQTGEIKNLGEIDRAGVYLNWSSGGGELVTNTPNTLDILSSFDGTVLQKDIIGDEWQNITGVDWSPDGKKIVFSGAKEYYPERLKTYLVDVKTKNIQMLPLDENLSYEHPQWSPDGKLIAMNIRPKWLDKVQGLSVYDVETQKIVANLEGERSEKDWYWSDDSEFILVTRGDPSNKPMSIELFYWKENQTKFVPLPKEIGNNYNVIKAIGLE